MTKSDEDLEECDSSFIVKYSTKVKEYTILYANIEEERKSMIVRTIGFKDKKMSQTKEVLKQMQFEKIFVSTALLLVITHIGLKIGTSLILVNVLNEIYYVCKAEYKEKTAKGFLK